jgi:hypothetical protein
MMWTRTWPRVSRTRGVVFMPERHIRVQRRMAASTDSVWALFADFPNLGSHWSGLRATRAIGDQTSGVGARRRVELKPIGSIDETVTIWEEGRRIDTQNLPSASCRSSTPSPPSRSSPRLRGRWPRSTTAMYLEVARSADWRAH